MSTPYATDRRRFWTRLTRGIFGVVVVAASVAVTVQWLRGGPGPAGNSVFRVWPYLQAGDASLQADRLALLWQTRDSAGKKPEDWGVEVRVGTKTTTAPTPWTRRVAIDDAEPFQRFRAELSGLIPGETFEYTVFHHDKPVFHAQSKAPAPPGTPQRFVVFGDAAAGTGEQTAVARRIHLAKPDYVVVTGDIVYMRGRDSEYLARFFPVYNGDEASGVPLLARPSSTRRPGITTSPSATSTSSPTDSPTSTNGRSP